MSKHLPPAAAPTTAQLSNKILPFPRPTPPDRPTVRRYKFAGLLADYSAGPQFQTRDWLTELDVLTYGPYVAKSPRYHHVAVVVQEQRDGAWHQLPSVDLTDFLAIQNRPAIAFANYERSEVA